MLQAARYAGSNFRETSIDGTYCSADVTVLEGALRKWVPGFGAGPLSYLAYFSKDIAFGALLLLPKRKLQPFGLQVFRAMAYSWLLAISPRSPTKQCERTQSRRSVLTLRSSVVLPFIAFVGLRRLNALALSLAACCWQD